MSNRFDFEGLINRSKRFSRDEFVANFGGIVEDVSAMLASDLSRKAIAEAREYIESKGEELLPNQMPRLQRYDFGNLESASELLDGKVAAVDGTPVLPLQKYSFGQALCVGIGSRSYVRPLEDVLHGYTTQAIVRGLSHEKSEDMKAFFTQLEEEIAGISLTAYMRYFESVHALEISEPYIFCDGTLIYQWLSNIEIGRNLYKKLLKEKKVIGVIKSLKESVLLSWLGRALKSGEVFFAQTFYEHVERQSTAQQREIQWLNDQEFVQEAKQIWRGVFKPRQKAFGFEVHLDHIAPMLRIMVADCQMNHLGHEIPFLLNTVDKEIRNFFKSKVLQTQIAAQLSDLSENIFFEEMEERLFRE
ncbi:hypothetical protein BECAL_03384 [Bellilinea caldifistulae]|jgi:hypothetical protein|uniref:Uncharacterized protein n=1 Tax=Bellilinea caldifistulae TaxID=360411 RepID=A0A0N8GMY7_9CHLR|nr:DNA double-strand break repair nuclease NurA [Bellilinea caldifistulae]KPL76610.1 hypothetical protein AC812_04620 [Bellilinea caldifistulae]GAP12181.1 hypothetical protein BECAL_03384 [Bellilinea caldifistulae]